MSKPFKLDLNLDDEVERDQFIERLARISSPERAAKALGLKGPGAVRLVTSLGRYAYHKRTAVSLRKLGLIDDALDLERFCDRVYRINIQPVCECW